MTQQELEVKAKRHFYPRWKEIEAAVGREISSIGVGAGKVVGLFVIGEGDFIGRNHDVRFPNQIYCVNWPKNRYILADWDGVTEELPFTQIPRPTMHDYAYFLETEMTEEKKEKATKAKAKERLGDDFIEIPRKKGTMKMPHPKRGGWKGRKTGILEQLEK